MKVYFLLLYLSLFISFAQTNTVPVHVYFGTNMVLTPIQIEAYARREFKKRGIDIPTDARCSINLTLKSTNAVCLVRFSKERKSFHLGLDANGRVVNAQSLQIRAVDEYTLTPEEKAIIVREVENNSVKRDGDGDRNDRK